MKNFSVADFIGFVILISRAFVVISVWNTVVIMKTTEQKIATSCPMNSIVNGVLLASQVYVNRIFRDMLLLVKVLGGCVKMTLLAATCYCATSVHVRTCLASNIWIPEHVRTCSSVSIIGRQTCVTTWQPTTQLNLVCMLLASELSSLHEC